MSKMSIKNIIVIIGGIISILVVICSVFVTIGKYSQGLEDIKKNLIDKQEYGELKEQVEFLYKRYESQIQKNREIEKPASYDRDINRAIIIVSPSILNKKPTENYTKEDLIKMIRLLTDN